MILKERIEWWIYYRAVEVVKTDMSHMGSHWDETTLGPWLEVGAYNKYADAAKHFWILRDKGYDCRLHEITTKRESITLLDPLRPTGA